MIPDSMTKRGRTLRLAVGTFLIFLAFADCAGALSNSGGGVWTHSRDLTISNPGAALSDYQLLVNLTGAAFPAGANASGADIRFEQGGMELSHWVEEWNASAKKGKVWVKVRSIPSGVGMMRMWWGNAEAGSGSDGDATFV